VAEVELRRYRGVRCIRFFRHWLLGLARKLMPTRPCPWLWRRLWPDIACCWWCRRRQALGSALRSSREHEGGGNLRGGKLAVREFLGALIDAGIPKGIFITLRGCTAEAKQLAEKHGIEIVNEAGLAELLASTDAKCDSETLSILRDKRKFCPKCECEMVVRTIAKGPGVGNQFWGCSTFPRCRFRMPFGRSHPIRGGNPVTNTTSI
jgi:hypothetical protein